MPALALQLTDAGLAAVQAASGSNPTVISDLGLTNTPFDGSLTLTSLPGEFRRLDVASGLATAANITHLTVYDTSEDVWQATGLGLFLDDGTLFAYHTSPEPIMSKVGLAFALLAFDVAFSADPAANIAYGNAVFAYPEATETHAGVAELATLAEARAGNDIKRIVTPALAKQAATEWLFGRTLHLGAVTVQTPNAGSSGGLRIVGNGASGYAYLQVLSPDQALQWGVFEFHGGGNVNWRGAGGLSDGGHRVWHAGNVGAGSGLDADSVDGWHAQGFLDEIANVRSALGVEATTRHDDDVAIRQSVARVADDLGQEANTRHLADVTIKQDIARIEGNLGDEANTRHLADVAMKENIAAVEGRAISGAGLITGGGSLAESRTLTVAEAGEQDMLDGTSDRVVVTPRRLGPIEVQIAQTGFLRFGRLQFAWGRFTANANGVTNTNFARSFANECFSVVASGVAPGGTDSQENAPSVVVNSITKDGFPVFSADNSPTPMSYFAVGY